MILPSRYTVVSLIEARHLIEAHPLFNSQSTRGPQVKLRRSAQNNKQIQLKTNMFLTVTDVISLIQLWFTFLITLDWMVRFKKVKKLAES